jgi:hypothetical protein
VGYWLRRSFPAKAADSASAAVRAARGAREFIRTSDGLCLIFNLLHISLALNVQNAQDFIPVLDSNAEKVIHIDFPPHYKRESNGKPRLTTESTAPPPLSTVDGAAVAASGRERIPPPLTKFDYLPDLLEKQGDFKTRDDVKPLHILQPEGVSFKMDGHVLTCDNSCVFVLEKFNNNFSLCLQLAEVVNARRFLSS